MPKTLKKKKKVKLLTLGLFRVLFIWLTQVPWILVKTKRTESAIILRVCETLSSFFIFVKLLVLNHHLDFCGFWHKYSHRVQELLHVFKLLLNKRMWIYIQNYY